MDRNEQLKNICVLAYMSYLYMELLREHEGHFPLNYLNSFKKTKKLGGHDLDQLRVALKLAIKEPEYLIPELPPIVIHSYSLEEMKWYFDKLDEAMDDCRGPLEA